MQDLSNSEEEEEEASVSDDESDDLATQLFKHLDVTNEGRIPTDRVIEALVQADFDESFFQHVRALITMHELPLPGANVSPARTQLIASQVTLEAAEMDFMRCGGCQRLSV